MPTPISCHVDTSMLVKLKDLGIIGFKYDYESKIALFIFLIYSINNIHF